MGEPHGGRDPFPTIGVYQHVERAISANVGFPRSAFKPRGLHGADAAIHTNDQTSGRIFSDGGDGVGNQPIAARIRLERGSVKARDTAIGTNPEKSALVLMQRENLRLGKPKRVVVSREIELLRE